MHVSPLPRAAKEILLGQFFLQGLVQRSRVRYSLGVAQDLEVVEVNGCFDLGFLDGFGRRNQLIGVFPVDEDDHCDPGCLSMRVSGLFFDDERALQLELVELFGPFGRVLLKAGHQPRRASHLKFWGKIEHCFLADASREPTKLAARGVRG